MSVRFPHLSADHLVSVFVSSAAPFSYESATGHVSATGAFLNLPALLISLVLMVLLVCGVRDSARFNNVMVAIKVGVVLFVIILGSTLVNTDNWFPFGQTRTITTR